MKRNRILMVSLCMLVLAGCQTMAEEPLGTDSTSETATVATETPVTQVPETSETEVEAIAMPSLEKAHANLPGDFILTAEASYPPGKFFPEIAEKAELIIRGRVTEVGESFMVERAGRPGTLMTVEVLEILKGETDREKLPIEVRGGTVSVAEYEAAMEKRPPEKDPYKDLTDEEKEKMAVTYYMDSIIPPAVGDEAVYFLYVHHSNHDWYELAFDGFGTYYVDETTGGLANPASGFRIDPDAMKEELEHISGSGQ